MEVDQKKAILGFCKELMVTARKNGNWIAFWTYHDNKVYTKSTQKTHLRQTGGVTLPFPDMSWRTREMITERTEDKPLY